MGAQSGHCTQFPLEKRSLLSKRSDGGKAEADKQEADVAHNIVGCGLHTSGALMCALQ